MHLTNEMLTLVPSNAISSAVTSPTTISPTVSGLPTGQLGAFNFAGIQGANLSCLQGALSGIPLNALPTALNGYTITGLPASCGLAATATNGYTVGGLSAALGGTPTSNCGVAGCNTNTMTGITINGVTMAPPTALTAPEVYGLPSSAMQRAAKSSSTSSSPDSPSSGESSPAPLSPAQS